MSKYVVSFVFYGWLFDAKIIAVAVAGRVSWGGRCGGAGGGGAVSAGYAK